MPLRDFLSALAQRGGAASGLPGVPYLSHQNDSLRDEFPRLAADVPPCIAFAQDAFGTPPDAVNLWIGDARAVTSVHKDHYENIYAVVRGSKHFTLLPPSDAAFLREGDYPPARYRFDASSGRFAVDREEGEDAVPWIAVDPLHPDLARFPEFAQASPVQVTVRAGEILYLPAMWHHRVAQSDGTVSVNYWHDMHFGAAYVYYNLARSIGLASRAHSAAGAGADAATPPPAPATGARGEGEGVGLGGREAGGEGKGREREREGGEEGGGPAASPRVRESQVQ